MSSIDDFHSAYLNAPNEKSYSTQAFRLVETQEFAATTNLVDDLDEQYLLEQMLDQVKPAYRANTEHMHYLLKTPFRYPPLQHGSRFGSRLLPSFFYASEQVETTLAEVAYYRFVFLSHMQQAYAQAIHSQHWMFTVQVQGQNCADLTKSEYEVFQIQLQDPQYYAFSQQVGKWLTQAQQVDVIRYFSARQAGGTNLAVYQPHAIVSKQPENTKNWLCLTQPEQISFTEPGGSGPIKYSIQQFSVDGVLPQPA